MTPRFTACRLPFLANIMHASAVCLPMSQEQQEAANDPLSDCSSSINYHPDAKGTAALTRVLQLQSPPTDAWQWYRIWENFGRCLPLMLFLFVWTLRARA